MRDVKPTMSTPPPHRIAFGITELDAGGAERMLKELVTRLDRTKWEPHVYCLGPEAHYSAVMRECGIPVTCFGGRGLADAPRIVWRWRQELRRFRPEILYTWLFHANILGRFAGAWANVPHILSGIRVAEKRHAWHLRLDRWTNFLVEQNVCVSRGVADYVEKAGGLDPRKTVVIPNAVNGSRFADVAPANLSDLKIPSGSPIGITIGRLEYQKGIDVLLSAIPIVREKVPHAHYLIVGNGPDKSSLERRAADLGIADRVHFLGRREDIPALLAASQLFILPSRWEGMPNVILEALAAGKPIVATHVEGVPELVAQNVNGWLVPPEEPQSLGESLTVALSDLQVLQRRGDESYLIYEKHFTIDLLVENHVRLFEKLVVDHA